MYANVKVHAEYSRRQRADLLKLFEDKVVDSTATMLDTHAYYELVCTSVSSSIVTSLTEPSSEPLPSHLNVNFVCMHVCVYDYVMY